MTGLIVATTYLLIGLIIGVGGYKRYEYLSGKGGNDITVMIAVICIPFWPLYLASLVVIKVWQAFSKYVLDNLPLHVAKIDVSKCRHGKYAGEITRPFLNFLNTSGPKTVEEDIRNFLEIDGWKKVVSQDDLYTKFVCKNSLYKQREG